MNSKVCAVLAAIGLALTLLATTAPAQAGSVIVAEIPFDFVAGQTTLPAGKYRIQRAVDANSRLLAFENVDHPKYRAIVATTPGDVASDDAAGTLVFNRYGDEHFLASVGLRGVAVCNVHMSEAEAHLAKSGAAHQEVSLKMRSR